MQAGKEPVAMCAGLTCLKPRCHNDDSLKCGFARLNLDQAARVLPF